jgi:hypothetical protein
MRWRLFPVRRASARLPRAARSAAYVCAAALSWLTLAWGEGTAPQAVVGTITAMQSPANEAADQPVDFDLRVDEAGPEGATWRPGDTLGVRAAAGLLYGTTLGDQVRLILSAPVAGQPRRTAVEVFRLGRGELVKPGKGAAVDIGPASAKVLVKMLAPLESECHQQTAALLQELAKSEPDRLRVQIFDFYKPAGVAESNRERLHCATVLVNNRYDFAIKVGDQVRKVSFMHRPNTTSSLYNSDDVVALVRQEIARLYPPPSQATGKQSASTGKSPASK